MEDIPFHEGDVQFHADVDSVLFVASSLRAFRVLPKINIRTTGIIRPTENAQIDEQLRLLIPQRQDGRRHSFFEFRLAGYGEHAIRVLFQYREMDDEEETPDVSRLPR